MGPQHDSCGRGVAGGLGGRVAFLQWGRNMIVAEGTKLDILTWECTAFNGAAT